MDVNLDPSAVALLDLLVRRLLQFATHSSLDETRLPIAVHMIGQLARARPHLAAVGLDAGPWASPEPELARETMAEWNARHAPAPRGELAA